MKPQFNIRPAVEKDLPVLGDLFTQAVRKIGPKLYTPEQVAVWSSMPTNADYFRKFIFSHTTFVADGDVGICGFSGISGAGRIASLYVRHDLNRCGVGSHLLCHVIAHAREKGIEQLWTEASKFSKPLFERHGFCLDRISWVERKGVLFDHHIMRMSLLP